MSINADTKSRIKARGIHYTPAGLATFLADRTFRHVPDSQSLNVLDPACGDGSLLSAAFEAARRDGRRVKLFGFDNDPEAPDQATQKLHGIGHEAPTLLRADFLKWEFAARQGKLLPQESAYSQALPDAFDVVIANPPYVRTQHLGSRRARQLGEAFGLRGRVDLYHAFIGAITASLAEGGLLGLLTSNRFLTTLAGQSVRELLWSSYELLELYDLGDTRHYSAAVLPMILIARRRDAPSEQRCVFTRVYELRDRLGEAAMTAESAIDALSQGMTGVVQIASSAHEIEQGTLRPLTVPSDIWMLSTPDREAWLSAVRRETRCSFGDVAQIRVGVKTTADNVFVRDDWDFLSPALRPEDELLRPLITHDMAQRWRAAGDASIKRVLYPHEQVDGRTTTIDLARYPRAQAYLSTHRDQLEARSYVAAAGRSWFEVWVPQKPNDWNLDKIVFPDISEEPRFFLDSTRAVVNGDCYWIPIGQKLDRELAYLVLGVANSAFAIDYYDAVFANRLYSGRRRFITQYVARFPLPRPSEHTNVLVALVRQLVEDDMDANSRKALEREVDRQVERSFGIEEVLG